MQPNPSQQQAPIQHNEIEFSLIQQGQPQNSPYGPVMQQDLYQVQPYAYAPQQPPIQENPYAKPQIQENNPYQQQPMISQGMPQVYQSKPVMAYPSECTQRYPEQFFCTVCQQAYVSRIESKWGAGSCLWCMMCSWSFVVAFLPCCVDGLRDIHHYCPSCNKKVGKRAFMCD